MKPLLAEFRRQRGFVFSSNSTLLMFMLYLARPALAAWEVRAMSNPQAPGERSPAEPTMEEILASIRHTADGKPGDREPEAPEPDLARRPRSRRAWRRATAPTERRESERPGAAPDAADPA